MRVGGIQQFSATAYPGHTAVVVYTQGCTFRCGYCAHPTYVDPARFCTPIPLETVFAKIDEQRWLIDAVVITGGEPLVHEDLPDFAKALRDMGLLVKLETNGADPDALRNVLDVVDFVTLDIKATPRTYPAVVDADIDPALISASLSHLRNARVQYTITMTLFEQLIRNDPELFEQEMRAFLDQRDVLQLQSIDASHCDSERFDEVSIADLEALQRRLSPIVHECRVVHGPNS